MFTLNVSISDRFIADFENQPAHGLAKKWDPQGQRTIGASLYFTNIRSHRYMTRGVDEARPYSCRGRSALAAIHSQRASAPQK